MRLFATVLMAALAAAPASAELYTVILGGLGGETRYDQRFAQETATLARTAGENAGEAADRVVMLNGMEATQEQIVAKLTALQSKLKPEDTLAVYLIGHGTSDGRSYKFNIPGPDLTGERLAGLLEKIPAARQLVVVATSSSGAALEMLKADGRLVVTATKNGREKNAAWFSKYWAAAFEDPEADTNKDERITAQEAFAYADAKVQEFFSTARNLATEHARLEGEAPETFTLARLGQAAKLLNDPTLAPLLRKREDIERKIDQLKLKKEAMDETAYFDELQMLLFDLAQIDLEIEEERK